MPESAFRHLQKAANLTLPGDTVYILNGTYNSTTGTVLNVTRSGRALGYITFKDMREYTPKIIASDNAWNTVSTNALFIVLEGVERDGDYANLTYDSALAVYLAQLGAAPRRQPTIRKQSPSVVREKRKNLRITSLFAGAGYTIFQMVALIRIRLTTRPSKIL